jgi:hypothetical protein
MLDRTPIKDMGGEVSRRLRTAVDSASVSAHAELLAALRVANQVRSPSQSTNLAHVPAPLFISILCCRKFTFVYLINLLLLLNSQKMDEMGAKVAALEQASDRIGKRMNKTKQLTNALMAELQSLSDEE